MLQSKFRWSYLLSAIIAILIIVASAGGLFLTGLYRDNTWTSSQFRGSDLVRLVVAVPLLVAALILARRGSQRAQLIWLGMLWLAQSLSFVISRQIPQPVINSGHPTGVVYALDLALLVPGMVLGAIWLWQRRPWGYVLAAIMMVKGTIYPLALIGMALFYADATGTWEPLTLFWVFFAVASLVASGFLFGNMQSEARQLNIIQPKGEVPSLGCEPLGR